MHATTLLETDGITIARITPGDVFDYNITAKETVFANWVKRIPVEVISHKFLLVANILKLVEEDAC